MNDMFFRSASTVPVHRTDLYPRIAIAPFIIGDLRLDTRRNYQGRQGAEVSNKMGMVCQALWCKVAKRLGRFPADMMTVDLHDHLRSEAIRWSTAAVQNVKTCEGMCV